jgi:DNA-binding response OmpR family regulator
MRVLLVEDDEVIAAAIRRGLTDEGFIVDHVISAELARASLAVSDFDTAVVDIGLPGESGVSLLRYLRKSGKTLPVVIVTARDSVTDRIETLDIGADDFLVKPFALPELAARCRVVVRRMRMLASSELRFGGLYMDLSAHTAIVDDTLLVLTRREWCILESLALRAGHVVSKEKLLHLIASWDSDTSLNAVEVQVSRLRVKLGSTVTVRTVRGLGYRLESTN